MTVFIQPILIALTMLLVPASARFAAKALSRKMDEGRVIATAHNSELRRLHAEQSASMEKMFAERSASMETMLAEHRTELMTDVQEIKALAQATNGKVAEHDKQLTKHEAKIEVLLALATKGTAE